MTVQVRFQARGEVRIGLGRVAEGAGDLLRAIEEDETGVLPSTMRARAIVHVVHEKLGAIVGKPGGR